nr:MAG: RNA-dependent RNA polymerase [Leviviridae sp.]
MKSLVTLQQMVLADAGTRCGVNTQRDMKTITSRIEDEGLSFLTITLPSFLDDLYRAIDDGCVSPNMFQSFKKGKDMRIPIFLSGFMEQVFDPKGGQILNAGDSRKAARAIQSIAQVTGLSKKIELPCTPQRVQKAFTRYVQNESHVREFDRLRSDSQKESFRRTSSILFHPIVSGVRSAYLDKRIKPGHGPGSTSDHLLGNSKWSSLAWPEQLEEYFSFGEYFLPNWRAYLDNVLDSGNELLGAAQPVKVIAVPKTLKTPRIIAMEQTGVQYVQQGVRRVIEEVIAKNEFLTDLIGYKSQLPNQEMAQAGSTGKPVDSFATLDLSDASDLVSNQLARLLFCDDPLVLGIIDSCRTREADVDGHGVLRLAKYASMGSALCFPVEAMVFSTIIFVAIQKAYPSSTVRELMKLFHGRVRVYGDDIIVPVELAQFVADELEAYGLKVNRAKSFWNGNFRESCGKEYYRGHDVTYVKVRGVLPERQMSSDERSESIVRTVALRNLMFLQGYDLTVDYLDSLVTPLLKGKYPVVEASSPVLGRLAHFPVKPERMHPHLHIPLVRGWIAVSRLPNDELGGWGALMKFFSKYSDLPNQDEKHLLRAGRSLPLRIKEGWFSPF